MTPLLFRRLTTFVVLGLAAFLAACASPDSRIKRNPEAYERLSASDQQLVREGRVGVGFSPEVVELALGQPDAIWERIDAQGRTEVWRYTTWEGGDGSLLYTGGWHRYWGPYYGPRYGFYPYYLSVPGRKERDVVRVSFRDGVVESVEQERKT